MNLKGGNCYFQKLSSKQVDHVLIMTITYNMYLTMTENHQNLINVQGNSCIKWNFYIVDCIFTLDRPTESPDFIPSTAN